MSGYALWANPTYGGCSDFNDGIGVDLVEEHVSGTAMGILEDRCVLTALLVHRRTASVATMKRADDPPCGHSQRWT